MLFDPDNKIVVLCAKGMSLEGEGRKNEAGSLFQQAWDNADDDFEKFTAAHYLARHQETVAEKLKWDEISLHLALKLPGDNVKTTYPSLYLNIAKCHEDLNDLDKAKEIYQAALSLIGFLPQDGYGEMIKAGIMNGIQRING